MDMTPEAKLEMAKETLSKLGYAERIDLATTLNVIDASADPEAAFIAEVGKRTTANRLNFLAALGSAADLPEAQKTLYKEELLGRIDALGGPHIPTVSELASGKPGPVVETRPAAKEVPPVSAATEVTTDAKAEEIAKLIGEHESATRRASQSAAKLNSMPEIHEDIKKIFADASLLNKSEKTAVSRITGTASAYQNGLGTPEKLQEAIGKITNDVENPSAEFKSISARLLEHAQKPINPAFSEGVEFNMLNDALRTHIKAEKLAAELPKVAAPVAVTEAAAKAGGIGAKAESIGARASNAGKAAVEHGKSWGTKVAKFAHDKPLVSTGAAAGVTALMAALWPNKSQEVPQEDGTNKTESRWGAGKITAVSLGTAATVGAGTARLWAKNIAAEVKAVAHAI